VCRHRDIQHGVFLLIEEAAVLLLYQYM